MKAKGMGGVGTAMAKIGCRHGRRQQPGQHGVGGDRLDVGVDTFAQDAVLKPFVLASKGAGDVAQKVEATKAALAKAGFTVAGSYSPYANTTVIGVTNDELRSTAAKSEHGGYGAAMRVAVVKVKDEVQVAYTNPTYWANIYRMGGDLKDTAAKLQAALGKVEEYRRQGQDRPSCASTTTLSAWSTSTRTTPSSATEPRGGGQGGRSRPCRGQAGRHQGLPCRRGGQEGSPVRRGDEGGGRQQDDGRQAT
jgi:hypothetical protein